MIHIIYIYIYIVVATSSAGAGAGAGATAASDISQFKLLRTISSLKIYYDYMLQKDIQSKIERSDLMFVGVSHISFVSG